MRPENESALAEAIKAASGPLRIKGGGTRGFGISAAASVLETGGLAGISLYEPGAMTMVAGAGTALAEIEAALASENQRLAFEPADLRGMLGREGRSTIGGVVAANSSGPRRIQIGACRDHVLGVRFVDGAGVIVKNGGRVMKNVTGYDLVKLLAGSRGALGVLSEVSFKTLPRPEVQVTLSARGLDAPAAVAAMSKALSSPYEVTGAAYLGAAGEVRLRLEGLAGSVSYRRNALAQLLGAGWDAVEQEASAASWRQIRDVSDFANVAGAVWRISVKPSDMPGVAAVLGPQAQLVCDWGGGLIWALLPEEGDAKAAALRAYLGQIGGHATLMRAGPALMAAVPSQHPEPPALAALSAALRAKFDPRGLFNPASGA